MSEYAVVLVKKKASNTSSVISILQRTAIRPHSEESVPLIVHEMLRSPGTPLDRRTRESMESRFGHDFSQVRVHTDSNATRFAELINACAFTVGQHIGFGATNYSPSSLWGKRLLAHELAHVVQQSELNLGEVNNAQYSKAEIEADQVSRHIVQTSAMSQASLPALNTVAISRSVPLGFIQADNGDDRPLYERAGSWFLGAIGGEFIDEPTFAQIGVDCLVSVIPYVDQACDARDISAMVYRLGFRGEHNRWDTWVSLVFTLIGLIPVVGSVIKSLSRAAIRGIRLLLRHIDEILQSAARLIRVDLSDVGRLRRYVQDNWPRFRRFGIDVWNSILAQGERLIDRIPRVFAALRPLYTSSLATLRRVSPNWLNRAFEDVRGAVDNVLRNIRQRLQRQGSEVSEEMEQEVERSFGETFSGAGPSAPPVTSPQRHVRGYMGESLAVDFLAANNHHILISHLDISTLTRPGIDIVTFREGRLFLIDNKALTRSGNVSSVSSLTTNINQNIQSVRQELTDMLANPHISSHEQGTIQSAIQALNSGNFTRAVTNANVAPDTRILSGVTQSLSQQGIQLIDVFR